MCPFFSMTCGGIPRLAAAASRMRALGVDRHAAELFAEEEQGVINGALIAQ